MLARCPEIRKFPHMRHSLLAVAVLTAALAGCGQKGPLYLPDDDKTVKERDKDVFL